MAGVAFGQQALRAYTAAQKKQRRKETTIDLQFVGGTRPSQQTESGPVAIKGPCPCSDVTTPHHE